jgi:fimbrial chaperone protein
MRIVNYIGVAIFLSVFLLMSQAMASVVMMNTRVIYPGDASELAVQLNNKDSTPSLMQMWVDIKSDPTSEPNTAEAPFVVLPALFRIEPNAGQITRLIYTGGGLPQDRESIFYLNMVQIPPKNTVNAQQNQLTVVLRSRMKLFYRPSGIEGRPDGLANLMEFTAKESGLDWLITANNHSGYFASLLDAYLVVDGVEVALSPDMVAPKSSSTWVVKRQGKPLRGRVKIKYTLVNDFGGQSSAEGVVNYQ